MLVGRGVEFVRTDRGQEARGLGHPCARFRPAARPFPAVPAFLPNLKHRLRRTHTSSPRSRWIGSCT